MDILIGISLVLVGLGCAWLGWMIVAAAGMATAPGPKEQRMANWGVVLAVAGVAISALGIWHAWR